MGTFDLHAYGVSELSHEEVFLVSGGIDYIPLVWWDESLENEFVMLANAVVNAGIVVANAGIAIAKGVCKLWDALFG